MLTRFQLSILLISIMNLYMAFSKDCQLSAIVSVYQCDEVCKKLYGTEPATQKAIFDPVADQCVPKTPCNQSEGFAYIRNNNTCKDMMQIRVVKRTEAGYAKYDFADKWLPQYNKSIQIVEVPVHYDMVNDKYRCLAGYISSRTLKVKNGSITQMMMCDIQDPNPQNYGLSPGEIKLNALDSAALEANLGSMYGIPQSQPGVKLYKMVGGIIIGVYALFTIITIHQMDVRKKERIKKQKQQQALDDYY